MKKPSEYSSAELLALESNLPNAGHAKLEAFAKLGVIAQQWMNRKAHTVSREIKDNSHEGAAEWRSIEELRSRMEDKA